MLQDCEQIQTCQMKPVNGNAAPRRSNQPARRPSSEFPSSSIFRFPVSVNQFQSLQESVPAVSTSRGQSEDRLIDPWRTRLARLQAARATIEQGTLGNLSNEGILNTVPLVSDEQGIVTSGDCVEPISSGIQPSFFPYSLFVSPPDILELQSGGNVQYELGTGANDDALYYSDLNEVACTNDKCNKRIGVTG